MESLVSLSDQTPPPCNFQTKWRYNSLLLRLLESKVRILFIIGAPGCGKSSLVLKMFQSFGSYTMHRWGLLDYMEFGDLVVLGKYNSGDLFGGTDKLSNAVIDDAERFLEVNRKSILLEGDRLANTRFIDRCKALGELRLVTLKLNAALLQERREARAFEYGKTQNPTWLAGRESKVHNLQRLFNAEVWPVDTDEQVNAAVQNFTDWLRGEEVSLSKAAVPKVQKLF